MKIEKMSEYALFNLRMIREQGSQAEQTKKLVKRMQDVQDESVAKLKEPNKEMQKFMDRVTKLNVV